MYKPKTPFTVPAQLLTCEYEKVNGVQKKIFTEGMTFFCSAKSYGGTERIINDQYVIEDTLEVETYFHPEINGSCMVKLLDDGSTWEIINSPENIDRRNQFLKFKLKRVKGGA